jgi:hypothetical protein
MIIFLHFTPPQKYHRLCSSVPGQAMQVAEFHQLKDGGLLKFSMLRNKKQKSLFFLALSNVFFISIA